VWWQHTDVGRGSSGAYFWARTSSAALVNTVPTKRPRLSHGFVSRNNGTRYILQRSVSGSRLGGTGVLSWGGDKYLHIFGADLPPHRIDVYLVSCGVMGDGRWLVPFCIIAKRAASMRCVCVSFSCWPRTINHLLSTASAAVGGRHRDRRLSLRWIVKLPSHTQLVSLLLSVCLRACFLSLSSRTPSRRFCAVGKRYLTMRRAEQSAPTAFVRTEGCAIETTKQEWCAHSRHRNTWSYNRPHPIPRYSLRRHQQHQHSESLSIARHETDQARR